MYTGGTCWCIVGRAETSAVFPLSSTPVSYRASNRVIEYFPHGQNV